METNEWIARCSARLHAQWPRWQQMEPETAVVQWLAQGIAVRDPSNACPGQ
jgi:hypothetical protein